MQNFSKIMLIIGMVIGSGFASGKEIAVFFSRFGSFSYIFIALATILFFGVFYWILSNGKHGLEKINSSKFYVILFLCVSTIFTSSMFAGTMATIKTNNFAVDIFVVFLLLIFCVFVLKKGISMLTKTNVYLIPFTVIILIACLAKNMTLDQSSFHQNFFSEFLFSILYVVMNVSTSSLIMAEIGLKMTKKNIFIVSLISSLILGVLLVFINMTILSNEACLNYSMPLLQISEGSVYILMRIVLFVGCLTTLISLVYTNSKNLSRLSVNGFSNVFVSIFLPFGASFLGFGRIVSTLYPIASVVGIFLVIPFLFKVKYKK